MRKRFAILSAVILVTALALFLLWNTRELYHFHEKRLREGVEAAIGEAAAILQNHNGSLLNNFSRVVTDKDFKQKMAFAAGFTHNSSKVSVTFDDDEDTDPQEAAAPFVLKIDSAYLAKHNITFKPEAVMGPHHFDSVFTREMDSLDIRVPYIVTPYSRFDSSVGDSVLSSPFILDFTQPVMYRARYIVPSHLVLRHLAPHILSSGLLLLLVVSAFVFVYRAYQNNEKSALFRQVLLGNFAHELKTPVTSLQLILEAGQRDGESGDMVLPAQHASFAISEIARIKLLLDKMLSIGKMTRDGVEFNREIVRVGDLVAEAVEAMSSRLVAAGGAIMVDDDGSGRMGCDRALMVNVLTVLLDNAVKYGGTPPVIEVTSRREGDIVAINVSDNGPGVPIAYRERIFEPFFRVPAGDIHPVPGHGLGLSFAREVIKLHKGKLDVEQGKHGAVFSIKLAGV